MADNKTIGLYWGSNALYFVETEGTTPSNIFQIPFRDSVKNTLKDGPSSASSMDLISDIQKFLKENNYSNSYVNLSLPAKDIIFRSFVIPWMEEHEIKSAVEFEASKYIPFSLEKLAFSFHPITFLENDTKRLRIIFVAIKNDILVNYVRILQSASLHISLVEPAPSSLIRALSLKLKSIIPQDQTIAFIEKEDVGRITVADKEIPQFVREFHLSTINPHNQQEQNLEETLKKFIGEVRISLDYFDRQNEQLKITHAILLSASNLEELSEALKKNLPISIIPVDDQSVLGDPEKKELGYLNAYGVSIISAVESPVRLNLSRQGSTIASKAKVKITRKPINFKAILQTALVCIPLMVGSIVAYGFIKQGLQKKTAVLTEKLGYFQDADVSTIEEKEKTEKDTLSYLKNIRMDSHASEFLLLIPNLLPEGTWIEHLDITYDDSATFELESDADKRTSRRRRSSAALQEEKPALTVTIGGYTYSENRNQQFRLVNQLLRNLKDDEDFSSFFSSIDVETTEAKKLNDFPVTEFKILCKTKNELKRPE